MCDHFKKEDKWINPIIAFIMLLFFTVTILQVGMWHGRNLERQEIAHTNEMWNEMVACFKIKGMFDKQINKAKRDKAIRPKQTGGNK